TAITLIVQHRQTRLVHAHETLLTLQERWSSPDFRARRRSLAAALLAQKGISEDNCETASFFETMGILLRRKALDEELVWNEFGYAIISYHGAMTMGRNDLKVIRDASDDQNVFAEFDALATRVLRRDARKRHRNLVDVKPSLSAIREYLESEAAE